MAKTVLSVTLTSVVAAVTLKVPSIVETGTFLMEIDYSLKNISVCMRVVEIGGLTFVETVVVAQQCLASIAVIFQPMQSTHLTLQLETQSILDSTPMEEVCIEP